MEKFEIYTQGLSRIKNHNKDFDADEWIKKLNDKNGNLSYNDILYSLIDIIDSGIIELQKIKKLYRIDETYGSPYLGYKLDVVVRILDKSRIKEYCDYRDDIFTEIMREVYGHKILNKNCSKWNNYTTSDMEGERIRHNFQAVYGEYDSFDLHPKYVIWLDKDYKSIMK